MRHFPIFQGFIHNEPFDPKTWIIPGTTCTRHILSEEESSLSKSVYIGRSRNMKNKTIADVTEALIGAFLSVGGEMMALSFMSWLGIDVDFASIPYSRNLCMKPELHIDIRKLESLLKYSFKDASLLVEALTHGSYMRPEIPGCYQVNMFGINNWNKFCLLFDATLFSFRVAICLCLTIFFLLFLISASRISWGCSTRLSNYNSPVSQTSWPVSWTPNRSKVCFCEQ